MTYEDGTDDFYAFFLKQTMHINENSHPEPPEIDGIWFSGISGFNVWGILGVHPC